MLRKMLVSLLISLMILMPINILAEDTTKIGEEQTPLVAKQDYSLYYAGFAVLIVVSIAIIYKNKHGDLKLKMYDVEDNEDGSYIVHLGYDNSTNDIIKFKEGETGLRVLKGNAILLKRDTYQEFEKGTIKDAIIVVVNKDSEFEYYAGNERIVIKGSELCKKGETK